VISLLFSLVLSSAPAQIRVLVDSPHERRQLVEIVQPDRLSYRVCRGAKVDLDNLLHHCRRLGPDLPATPAVRERLRTEFVRALSDSLVVYAYETGAKTVGRNVLRDSLVYTGLQLAFVRMIGGPLARGEWLERGLTAYAAWMLGNGVVEGGTAWGRRRHLATLVDVQDQVARANGRRPARLLTSRGLWPRPSTEMQLLINAMRHALIVTNAEPIIEGD
jgi:hypothetical protein